MWTGILVASVGCWLLKLAGLSMPQQLLEHPRVRRIVELLPIALLAALIAVQTFTTDGHLTVDARTAGVAVAVVAVARRLPFLAVLVLACATTALVRAVA
jgi:uncharacterized membrane protein